MKLDREGRRIVAQFLNGVAVAVVATMFLTPIAGGKVAIGTAALGLFGALTLHAVALIVAARR
ncbi:hypothetical protein [Devosia sp.]|uniref:hypothetical protein n=1 Tax=Devosia sp. TaxID=1871048 RepID=UPI002FCC888B